MAGSTKNDVSQLVKGFGMVSNMSKQMSGMGMMQRMKAMAGLGSMDMAALGGSGGAPKLKGSTKRKKSKFQKRKRRSR